MSPGARAINLQRRFQKRHLLHFLDGVVAGLGKRNEHKHVPLRPRAAEQPLKNIFTSTFYIMYRAYPIGFFVPRHD